MNNAKKSVTNFASDAGIGGDGGKKDDEKIAAKVAKHKAVIGSQKEKRDAKNEELAQRVIDRKARKAELEKARGFR